MTTTDDTETRVTYLSNQPDGSAARYIRVDEVLSDKDTWRGWTFSNLFLALPKSDWREVPKPDWLRAPEPKKEHWQMLLPMLRTERERLGFEPLWLTVCREYIEDLAGD